MPVTSGVTVNSLLHSRPEAFGLPLELLAGADGLARVITSPHIQKTGLALAGFHEYLKPGRVLIFGESGIGKSECALDLIVRGHRLVADDTVEIRRRAETILIGTCPELTRHHMELRGLGLTNVKDLFGIASTP